MAQTESHSKLDLTKPVQTRSGLKVRIVCTDCPGKQPVVGVFEDGMVRQFNASGSFHYDDHVRDQRDLVNVPVTVRVCFYNKDSMVYSAIVRESSDEAMWRKICKVICIKDVVLDT